MNPWQWITAPIAAVSTAISTVFKAWTDGKVAKYQAEAALQMRSIELAEQWDVIALLMSRYSWKDELITLVVFAPLILWWFPQLRADAIAWVQFAGNMPYWYQFLMFGIAAASFGLRWFFKDQGFKIAKESQNG